MRQSRTRIATPITANAAYRDALFSGLPFVTTRLVRDRTFDVQTHDQLRSAADAPAVLAKYFEDRDREEFVVLDTANRITSLHVASVGGLAAAIVEPRQVFKASVLADAAALLLAHNHTLANPEPSREDVAVTKQLVEAGPVMVIPVHNHIILAGRGYTSLAERGLIMTRRLGARPVRVRCSTRSAAAWRCSTAAHLRLERIRSSPTPRASAGWPLPAPRRRPRRGGCVAALRRRSLAGGVRSGLPCGGGPGQPITKLPRA